MVQISLVKIPSFVGNFVKKTIQASYDALTGNISLVRDVNCVVDGRPDQNTYQKILKHSKLPTVLPNESNNDAALYEYNRWYDGINIVEVDEKEFKELVEHERHLPTFISFTTGDDDDDNNENLYHVFPLEEDEEEQRKENNDEIDAGIVERISSKIESIRRAVNPIMCVQYLTLFIDFFQISALRVVSNLHELELAIQELLLVTTDNDATRQVVTFFPKHTTVDASGLQTIKEVAKPNDVMILYNSGKEEKENGIYLVANKKEEEGEETTTDNEDGDVCTLLIQIGASIFSSVALLVAKQIRKYLKKHNKKKTTTTEKEEEKEIEKPRKNIVHVKMDRKEGKGKSLWDKVNMSILLKTTNKRKLDKEEVKDDDDIKKTKM